MVIKWSLVPLVQLKISKPTDKQLASMFQRQVVLQLKDSSTTLSDRFRHIIELINKNKGTSECPFNVSNIFFRNDAKNSYVTGRLKLLAW